jgi:hypothetical protein
VSDATSSNEPEAGPIAFALDNVNSKIYWHDAGLDAIRRGDLDNTQKENYVNNSGFIYSMIIPVENAISLPIILESFTGQHNANAVLLRWNTSGETNAAAFEIERATNSKNFVRIATLNANERQYLQLF